MSYEVELLQLQPIDQDQLKIDAIHHHKEVVCNGVHPVSANDPKYDLQKPNQQLMDELTSSKYENKDDNDERRLEHPIEIQSQLKDSRLIELDHWTKE
jgi:hypothetical protein